MTIKQAWLIGGKQSTNCGGTAYRPTAKKLTSIEIAVSQTVNNTTLKNGLRIIRGKERGHIKQRVVCGRRKQCAKKKVTRSAIVEG